MDKAYEYIGTRIYQHWECGKQRILETGCAGKAASKESHQPGGWVCGSQLNRGKNKARQRLGRTSHMLVIWLRMVKNPAVQVKRLKQTIRIKKQAQENKAILERKANTGV